MCPLCGVQRVLCGIALRRSSSVIFYACVLSGLLCCLLFCGSVGSAFAHAGAWGRSSALCVTARGCFAAYCAPAASLSPTACTLFPVCCVATTSTACGVPFWLIRGLVETPPPLVQLLVGAILPFAAPLWTTPPLCELSLVAPPLAPLLMGLVFGQLGSLSYRGRSCLALWLQGAPGWVRCLGGQGAQHVRADADGPLGPKLPWNLPVHACQLVQGPDVQK